MIRSIALCVALAVTAIATTARADSHEQCSQQMIDQVENRMPFFEEQLDVNDLSCNGLAQVYIILTRNTHYSTSRQRQAILAVFRREGLVS